MVELFGWIFLWGIPALLLWSIVLSIIRMVKDPEKGQFLGRTLTFIGAIYSYTVGSLVSWFGLICLVFGIVGYTEGAILGPTMFMLFGSFLVNNFFPRYNMHE